MKVRADVYLNESPDHFFGYKDGHLLTKAASFDFDDGVLSQSADGVASALHTIFRELNIDDPTAWWAVRYREDRHRSLSVGDVVVLGETAWAVASVGWEQVILKAEQIIAVA
ncbi:hypothetical protein MAHJHV61_39770 [Mycobacterium avium subsp. hominissuis]|uniref:hypothetical protein n=1 Tax=Mycobacterium avium TaxID=1764 RepID=UPI0009FBC6F9|nr:hypothetical protein [Mycobacterium avium]MBZ4631355.1 hypothetical protein [Mycobacterium avium subsp. hominissuis]